MNKYTINVLLKRVQHFKIFFTIDNKQKNCKIKRIDTVYKCFTKKDYMKTKKLKNRYSRLAWGDNSLGDLSKDIRSCCESIDS